MKGSATRKPLYWIGSSRRDLRSLPAPVVDVFGYALYLAQAGKKHDQAKPLTGFGSAAVLEIVEDGMEMPTAAFTQFGIRRPASSCLCSGRKPDVAWPRRRPTWIWSVSG